MRRRERRKPQLRFFFEHNGKVDGEAVRQITSVDITSGTLGAGPIGRISTVRPTSSPSYPMTTRSDTPLCTLPMGPGQLFETHPISTASTDDFNIGANIHHELYGRANIWTSQLLRMRTGQSHWPSPQVCICGREVSHRAPGPAGTLWVSWPDAWGGHLRPIR